MDRYPGTQPFSAEDKQIFFGRENETIELFRLIILHKLVVLFGKSGTGKSSLLQAGVSPLLHDRLIHPVFIRLNSVDQNNSIIPPEKQVYFALKDNGYISNDIPDNLTFWEYIHTFNYAFAGEQCVPLLVFDQFEELFTLHHSESRNKFISQLADLANEDIHESLQEALKGRENLQFDLNTTPEVKLLFSIRSDYLYLLDQLSSKIPEILLCRYELQPLKKEMARRAIEIPASLENKNFDSPKFSYTEHAISDICNTLGKKQNLIDSNEENGEIEASQLQLLCSYIEHKIIDNKFTQDYIVDTSFYGGKLGIQRILQDFYKNILNTISRSERILVEKLVEQGLIQNKRRIILEESYINSSFKVSSETLNSLTNHRLLRKEPRKGIDYYEISHDTLIEPILAEYERHKFTSFRKKILFSIFFGIVVISGITLFALWTLQQKQEAIHQKNIAQSTKLSVQSYLARTKNDVDLANLLAIEANSIDTLIQAEKALIEALNCSPHLYQIFHTGANVSSVSISPDGKYSVAGTYDATVQLWEIRTGRLIFELPTRDSGIVYSITFSPDGKFAASGDQNGIIIIWDLNNKIQKNKFNAHDGIIWSLCYSLDGRFIYSGGNDENLNIWESSSGNKQGSLLNGEHGIIWSVTSSLNGKYIAAGLNDYTICLWDAQSKQMVGSPIKGHEGIVYTVGFSIDGQKLVSGSDDKTVRVWDVNSGEQIGKTCEGHEETVWGVVFSKNAKQVISAANDKTIRIWEIETGMQIGRDLVGHLGPVLNLASDFNRQFVVSGAKDETVRVWDIQTGNQIGNTLRRHSKPIFSVKFSPNGKKIASASEDKSINLWNYSNGTGAFDNTIKAHQETVWGLDFSPTGDTLVSSSYDLSIKLWDVNTGKLISIINNEAHPDWIREIKFSPDGKYIASASSDNEIRLWKPQESSKPFKKFLGHESSVVSISFSPDSKKIVSSSYDKTIRIWDIETEKQLGGPLYGHESRVWSVDFSPDGNLIVSGSEDQTIRLWNAKTHSQIGKPIWGTLSDVYCVKFSPNGKYIVSGSDDQTIRVWDVKTQTQIGRSFWGHVDAVRSVDFGPDGETILSGSEDNTVRLWRFSPPISPVKPFSIKSLIQRSKKLVNRNLTGEEIKQYVKIGN